MPMIDWATAGTATVGLTILEQPEGNLERSSNIQIPGCFIKNDDNFQHFVEKFIDISADRKKFNPANSRYIFYSPVNKFKADVTKAVLTYEKISKKRYKTVYEQKTKTCTVEKPLVITFDGHFFLCCDSEDLNKSKFLEEYSKEVRINQILDPSKSFRGLGMEYGYLLFIKFNMSQCKSQNDIYITDDSRVYNKLKEAGPLLLNDKNDKKTIVGCYRKSNGNCRIKINMFGKSQDDPAQNSSPPSPTEETPPGPTERDRAPYLLLPGPPGRDQTPTLPLPDPTERKRAPTLPPPSPPEGDRAPTLPPPGPPERDRTPTLPPPSPPEGDRATYLPPPGPTERGRAPTLPSPGPTERDRAPDSLPSGPIIGEPATHSRPAVPPGYNRQSGAIEHQDQTVPFLYEQLRLAYIRYLDDYVKSGRGTLDELKDRFCASLPQLTENEREEIDTVKKLVKVLEDRGGIGASDVEILKMLALEIELKENVEKFEAGCSDKDTRSSTAIYLKTVLTVLGAELTLAGATLMYIYATNPEKLENLQPFVDLGAQVLALLRGSVVFVLKVSSISSLKRLWQSYKDGSLKEKLKKSFNEMEELKELSQGEEIDLGVTTYEKGYREVLSNLILMYVKSRIYFSRNIKRRHSVCCERDAPKDKPNAMDVEGKSVKDAKSQRRHSVCCERGVPEDRSQLIDVKGNDEEKAATTTPAEILARSPEALEAYKEALLRGKTKNRRVLVTIVGPPRAGKTSLLKSLKGEEFDPAEDSTTGVVLQKAFCTPQENSWFEEDNGEGDLSNKPICEFMAEKLESNPIREGKTATETTDSNYQAVAERHPSQNDVEDDEYEAEESVMENTSIRQSFFNESKQVANKFRETEMGDQTTSENEVSSNTLDSSVKENTSLQQPDYNESLQVPKEVEDTPVKENTSEISSAVPKEVPDSVVNYFRDTKKMDHTTSKNEISLKTLDFAGQQVYEVILPLFMSSKSIYILVYNLDNDLLSDAQPKVKHGNAERELENHFQMTHLDAIEFWLSCILSYANLKKEVDSDDRRTQVALPPVFVVCTHADVCKQDPKEVARELCKILTRPENPYGKHIVPNVYTVDNTLSGKKEVKDESAKRLKSDVEKRSKLLPQVNEDIPVSWLRFEEELSKLVEKEQKKYVDLEEAKRIATKCNVNTATESTEFTTLINYMHDLKTIIYFEETRTVFIDTQWLVNMFVNVITVMPFEEWKEYAVYWRKLEDEGILQRALVEHVWSDIASDGQNTVDSLLLIMEKFSLICPWKLNEEKVYLVPCMLYNSKKKTDHEDIEMLLADQKSSTMVIRFKSVHLPMGIFPRLFVALAEHGKKEWPAKVQLNLPKLRPNFCRMYNVGQEGRFDICITSGVRTICVTVYNKNNIDGPSVTKFCQTVRKVLDQIFDAMQITRPRVENMELEYGIRCPICTKSKMECSSHKNEGCKRDSCLHFVGEKDLKLDRPECYEDETNPDTLIREETYSHWFPKTNIRDEAHHLETNNHDSEATESHITMATLIGVLVDVSGSMKASFGERPNEKDTQKASSWARSILKVAERIKHYVSSANHVFALAFGASKEPQAFDLLGTLALLLERTREMERLAKRPLKEILEEMLTFLENNGAPRVRTWASREVLLEVVERSVACSFLLQLKRNDTFRRRFVHECLPETCRKLTHSVSSYAVEVLHFGAQLIPGAQEYATKGSFENVVAKGKELLSEVLELVPIGQGAIMDVHKASEILHGGIGEEELNDERVDELMDAVEPFIYGGTPLMRTIDEEKKLFAAPRFKEHTKLMFIISAGEPDDGNNPPMKELDELGVTTVCCYITKDYITHPKRLYSTPCQTWDKAAKLMFQMSSTITTQMIPRTIFIKRGWKIDITNNETRLFVQLNHPDIIKDVCDLARNVVCCQDALSDLLATVSLDLYINQANQTFVRKTQTGGPSYANASAAVLYLSMQRIVGRDGGYPDFFKLREKMIKKYGEHGANTLQVLQEICPEYRLQCKKVGTLGAMKAITAKRPVLAKFRLTDPEWATFKDFYRQNPRGVLTSAVLDIKRRPPGASRLCGHAVVLTSFNSESLRLMNSWGSNWGDGGFFKVSNADVLGLKFVDVFCTVEDLKQSEIDAYQRLGPTIAQKMFSRLRELQKVQYPCPWCKQSSNVTDFSGHHLEAVCPKCHKKFNIKEAGDDLALNMYLLSLSASGI